MLTLERLQIGLGDFALRADWAVPAGAHVAVVGPSGAGKSTLLLAIAGFLRPVAGRVLWQGHDLAARPPGERPVSILFQDNNLFPHLTVAQNVGLGLSPALRLSVAQHARVEESLARVGLEGRGNDLPAQLSGGQMGRVALARALLRSRPILLLDEPFATLGPGLRADMLALVGEVADATGALVLLVSHDPRDARTFADLTVLVESGCAHPPVPTGVLFSDPPPALRSYLGDAGA